MKFLVAFVALVAVVAADFRPLDSTNAQLEAIVAAIASPSTDPGTAALLEAQLAELLAPVAPVAPAPVGGQVPIKPTPVSNEVSSEIHEIIAAISSPSTDPATAAALTELLAETLGLESVSLLPVEASPAIVTINPVPVITPIVPDVPVITPVVAPTPVITPVVEPTPAVTPVSVTAPAATDASPLVQIILNINSQAAEVAAAPAVTPAGASEIITPEAPYHGLSVVEGGPVFPVAVIEPVAPVTVVESAAASGLTVVESAAASGLTVVEGVSVVESVVEPISVVNPVMPLPAVNLPLPLN